MDASASKIAAPVLSAPQDDDDLRGLYFRQVLASRTTQVVGSIAVLIAAVVGGIGGGPLIGVIAVAGVVLAVLVVCFFVANSRAKTAFYEAYAASRKLSYSGERGALPPVCELLRKGDRRYTERSLTGALPGGPNGTLAHYTYEEENTDSKGNRQTTYYHYTVVFCELPQLAEFVQELVCHHRSGFRFLDSTEDKFRKRQRVEIESDAFDKRFESFAGEHDDMNRIRQIYEPTFIVWLAEQAPKNFEWDVVAGSLVCSVKGQLDSTVELDGLCAAAGTVAKRLFDEAGESAGMQAEAPAPS
jgi:hypothetical protein